MQVRIIAERNRLIKYETTAYRIEDFWVELERSSTVRRKLLTEMAIWSLCKKEPLT